MYGIKEKVLDEIRSIAQKYDVERVMLFGSRARGDYKERSDIDLAFEGGDGARFALDVNEDTSTLLMFDVVDLGRSVQEALRQSIANEGIVIYEKRS